VDGYEKWHGTCLFPDWNFMLEPATCGASGVCHGWSQIISKWRPIMRSYSVIGIILIALGILALTVRGFTYFTTDQVVGPLGFFAWEVEKPHTIIISPIGGILALAVGVGLLFAARRSST
jgi:hypothetical protein